MDTPPRSNLSLQTAFHPSPSPLPRRHRALTPSSTTTSPSSSPRPNARRSLTSSPSNSYRSSRSSRFLAFPSRLFIRRRPSTVDLAFDEELHHASHVEHLGLSLMEPRPVNVVPVSVGTSEIWDGRHRHSQQLRYHRSSFLSTSTSTATEDRLSWYEQRQQQQQQQQRRSIVMGNDSPIDFEDDGDYGIEGRLFGERASLIMPPVTGTGLGLGGGYNNTMPFVSSSSSSSSISVAEEGSFVMGSIFEVMERGGGGGR